MGAIENKVLATLITFGFIEMLYNKELKLLIFHEKGGHIKTVDIKDIRFNNLDDRELIIVKGRIDKLHIWKTAGNKVMIKYKDIFTMIDV